MTSRVCGSLPRHPPPRHEPVGDLPQGLAYGLILGGALGNMIDRLMTGYVVDFVLLHWGNHYFPAFNVADAALSCGAVLWVGCMIRDSRAERGG